jgi:hypothetical protein
LTVSERPKNIAASDLSKDGAWIRDSSGRYMIFRGVNFGSRSKTPPYLPIAPLNKRKITKNELLQEIESVKPELDFLNEMGFNVVRLLIIWKAIEPAPNPDLDNIMSEGDKYLSLVKEIVDSLYERGIFVILDFHQDIAHEIYGGDGFPDWALAIDEEHKLPSIPSDLKDKEWASYYYLNPLVRHTLRSFWRNSLTNIELGLKDYPVRTHLEKTIGQTIKFFKAQNDGQGHPAIFGIEPFNEPHQVGLSKKEFETNYLKEFYLNVNKEIRKFDNKIFLFIQPRVDWNIYSFQEISDTKLDWKRLSPFDIDINLNFIRRPADIVTYLPLDAGFIKEFEERGVFSFHYYDPWTMFYSFFNLPDNMYNKQIEWPGIFAKLVDTAVARDLIPFVTEYGGNQDWEYLYSTFQPSSIYQARQIRPYMSLQFTQVDSYLLNSVYWNYDLYNTPEGKDNWNEENFSLLGPRRKPRHIDIVARPYPMQSSAKPRKIFYDIKSRFAVIMLEGAVVDAPTTIYIPFNLFYSPKFYVWATGDKLEWMKENQILYWYPAKEQMLNQIIISSADPLRLELLSDESKHLLSGTKHTAAVFS